MRPNIIKPLISMLVSPSRMAGRTWMTEFCRRTLAKIFRDSDKHGVDYLRAALDGAGQSPGPRIKVDVTEKIIAGIPCVITRPSKISDLSKAKNHLMIYFHGGGFIAGSAQGYQNLISKLAEQANIEIIAPNYRLSPEHPFPAAQDDSLILASAVLDDNREREVFLCGDSAGGNLAISTAISLAREDRKHQPKALILMSPWVSPGATSGSVISNRPNDIFTLEWLQKGFLNHVGAGDPSDPGVDVSLADLSQLPPTYIQCAGGELFVDQIRDFDQRAREAGIDINLDVYETQFHDFQAFWALLKDAREAISKIAKYIDSKSG